MEIYSDNVIAFPPEAIPLLDTETAAKYLNVSVRTLEGWRYKGGGPLFISLGSRTVKYRLADLNTWIQEKVRTNTSKAA